MEDSHKQTPLNEWHINHGAAMVEFSGWSMPLWYPAGAVAEHRAVITQAGIFDTSHMSVVSVIGEGSFDLLQLCFTRDLTSCSSTENQPLASGQCVYGAFLSHSGELIDDAVLYQIGSHSYILFVNAGMGGIIAKHLQSYANSNEVKIDDKTGKVGKIDLQGPLSAKILMGALQDAEQVLLEMKYFTFRGHYDGESSTANVRLTNGTPVLLSRTGYTGELGFELLVDSEALVSTWEMILSHGNPMGLIPCGLAARDSLRAGAMLPLSHQDIGPWPFINHPWGFALPYTSDKKEFTKTFIGDVVLELQRTSDHTYAYIGPDPRKVSPHGKAMVFDENGNEIGTVLTCVSDMAIGIQDGKVYSLGSMAKPDGFKPRGLSCGFIKVKKTLAPGQRVVLQDNRRSIKVTIVDDIRPDRTARRSIREMM